MASDVTSILKYAIISRILILSLILLFRTLLDPYDTSASLNLPCLTSTAASSIKRHVVSFLQVGSAIEMAFVWDSVYFIRIAECSYEYEQSFAFLPLLPSLITLLSHIVFRPLVTVIGERATSGVAGYVVNNVAFVIAAVYLYRLSAIILKDKESALHTSILFCFNPASVFYSSILCSRFMMLRLSKNVLLGVGFLKYFQFKQLPNFLLASPILSLALFSIFHYVRSQPESFFSLGFKFSKGEKRSEGWLTSPNTVAQQNVFSEEQENINLRQRRKMMMKETTSDKIYDSERQGDLHVFIVPCTLHLGFMAATALFIMHVQVATRFLSASLPVYWFASYLLAYPRKAKRWRYMIWAYSIAYILLGSLLFSNFYPFT